MAIPSALILHHLLLLLVRTNAYLSLMIIYYIKEPASAIDKLLDLIIFRTTEISFLFYFLR